MFLATVFRWVCGFMLVVGLFSLPRPGVAEHGESSDHPRVEAELLALAERPENAPVPVWIVFYYFATRRQAATSYLIYYPDERSTCVT